MVLDEDRDVSLYSLAAEREKAFTSRLSGVAGVSWNQQTRDDASDSDEPAYLVGARYSFSDSTRLRGSYARQVRFPTLRDLYEVDRGNPALEPEKTDNFELALQHDLLDGRSTVELVLYQVDAEDFIERGPSGLAENVEETRFRGVELNGQYMAGENLQLRLGYTYLDAENRSADAATTALQNRPEHKLSLRMDYDLATGTRFYGSYMHVAGAVTLSRDTPVTTAEVGDYNVFDLGISHSLWNDRVRLLGRVENLFDEDYQESSASRSPAGASTSAPSSGSRERHPGSFRLRYLIGIDDTDNLESRGTGFRARCLGADLAAAGLARVDGVSRHQLLVHPDIPYTSHNSALCLDAHVPDGRIDEVREFCRDFLLRESADGSDAGSASPRTTR